MNREANEREREVKKPMTVQEFCDFHRACSEGRKWALKNCASMDEAWAKAKPEWVLWIGTRKGVLPDRELRLFAVRCARSVQHLMKDARSGAAIDGAERYANGMATDAELAAASAAESAAASAAAWAAAWSAASAAASAAAWAAAWSAARDAARDAAWAAARAAARAAESAAARSAASAAARDAAWAAARAAAWAAAWSAARDAFAADLRKLTPNFCKP